MIKLSNGAAVLVLAPELGGAVAAYDIGGMPVFHPVADPALGAQRGAALAAYPLVPFSNRIAWGRFTFEGESYQLARNFGDHPHTIHGNAWMHPWTVEAAGEAHALLSFTHRPPADDPAEWPFAYRTAIDYRLAEDGLEVVIEIENIDGRNQPVGFGFHPYYPRGAGARLGFSARSYWHVAADALPDARVPVEGAMRFDPPRLVGDVAIDNCFNDWFGCVSVEWKETGRRLGFSASPPFLHLVVFTPPGKPYIAAEPATNMTDAVNRMSEPDHGLRVLAPGERFVGRVAFTVRDAAPPPIASK